MRPNSVLWIWAIVITMLTILYQRMTGPTYPIRGTVRVTPESFEIDYRLDRSHDSNFDYMLRISVPDNNTRGKVEWRRYPGNDAWSVSLMTLEYGQLVSRIPKHQPTQKIEYKVFLEKENATVLLNKGNPVVMRFKGTVPEIWLIPHIIFMFIAMILANRAGLGALCKESLNKLWGLTLWTLGGLLLGGLVFGGIVQHYAFGAFWTGFPLGTDLTDTKTLISIIFWMMAGWHLNKNSKHSRKWVIIASIVMLAMYCIPHSLLGS